MVALDVTRIDAAIRSAKQNKLTSKALTQVSDSIKIFVLSPSHSTSVAGWWWELGVVRCCTVWKRSSSWTWQWRSSHPDVAPSRRQSNDKTNSGDVRTWTSWILIDLPMPMPMPTNAMTRVLHSDETREKLQVTLKRINDLGLVIDDPVFERVCTLCAVCCSLLSMLPSLNV